MKFSQCKIDFHGNFYDKLTHLMTFTRERNRERRDGSEGPFLPPLPASCSALRRDKPGRVLHKEHGFRGRIVVRASRPHFINGGGNVRAGRPHHKEVS